jgi:hypothetical protein
VAFDNDFYGRTDLIAELLDPHQPYIHLVGHRRTGKTSVLHRLAGVAGPRTVPLFIDLQSTGKRLTGLGRELVDQIDEAQTRFPELKRVKRKPLNDACVIIRSLADVTKQHQLAVLMLWDEGERLLDMDSAALGCLRAALQKRPHVRTILAATQRLRRLLVTHSDHTSPFLNGFIPIALPLLSEAEALDLIRQPHNLEGPVDVTDSEAAQIIELTGGQPYLIQVLCRHLFQRDGHLRPITADDLVVDETLSSSFQNDYDGLLPEERAILKALAHEPASPADLARTLKVQPGDVQHHLHEMTQTGLLSRHDGAYQVANFFLQNWLVTGRMQEPDADQFRDTATRRTIQRQRKQAADHLRLIEDRIAEYVVSTDVPLQLIKEQRYWRDRLAELEVRSHAA